MRACAEKGLLLVLGQRTGGPPEAFLADIVRSFSHEFGLGGDFEMLDPHGITAQREGVFRKVLGPASSGGGQFSRRIPRDSPREASTSLISVRDFLPRFGVFSNSTSVR